jgi:hypothetical protein
MKRNDVQIVILCVLIGVCLYFQWHYLSGIFLGPDHQILTALHNMFTLLKYLCGLIH